MAAASSGASKNSSSCRGIPLQTHNSCLSVTAQKGKGMNAQELYRNTRMRQAAVISSY